jgi:hypothetical protein
MIRPVVLYCGLWREQLQKDLNYLKNGDESDQIKFRSKKQWSYKTKDHAIFDFKSWSKIIDLRSSHVW